MPSLVEMQYNPYLPNLRLLLNGKHPSDYSRLVQYSDEDICHWYREILDAIYAEIRDDFAVVFTGTPKDAKVIEALCRKHDHCRGFRAKEFVISTPLQSRLKELNQYIKKAGATAYERTIIDAVFLVPPKMQHYLEEINSIDISNLFCTVRTTATGLRTEYEETENSFLFLLSNRTENGIERLRELKIEKPAFVLVIGENEGLIKVTDEGWFWGVGEDDLTNAIFECMLHVPLLYAFRKAFLSMKKGLREPTFRKISAVDPVVNVQMADNLETGKSSKINLSLDPPIGALPKLDFKSTNMTVLSCDGINIYGKQEGSADLEIYLPGDNIPFFVKTIKVYRRNRITKIVLSDDSVLLGKGDKKKIHCDYYPRDADNISTIAWKSSNPKIVRIDQNGTAMALAIGSCRIICTAENVSAQCMVEVKPYLESISINLDMEDNVLKLEPLQEVLLDIQTYPKNCVDDKIIVSTSDFNAVNVVNRTLFAKTDGEAMITVKNSTGRVSQSFKAVVITKKTGFFAKLFNKK